MNNKLERIKAYAQSRTNRQGLRRKAPLWIYPAGEQRKYTSVLLEMVRAVNKLVEERIIARLPQFVQEAGATRMDAWPEEIDDEFIWLNTQAETFIAAAQAILTEIGEGVGIFNNTQFRQLMRSTIGVDVFAAEPWLESQLKSWASENSALIKSLPTQELDKIQAMAQRGVRSGASAGDIAKEIRAQFGVTESRAKLIARDQIGKLNGKLTEYRQRSIGITQYTWASSRDERVRESHKAMQGKLCRWDDATVYSDDGGKTWKKRSTIGGVQQHPQMDFQCRCDARADTESLLEELGI